MQTWGYSMLEPFVPGDWVPDLVVGLMPVGVPDSEIDSVRHVKGVVADQCVPLAVEQTKFAEDVTGARVRASSSRQDNCVMVGVDPEKALGGEKPMFNFQFVEGSRQEALEKLKRGRYCLVPDHFQRESGLGVGGKFAVIPPESPQQRVEYEIAGVVSMTGWHWMSKVGLRNRGGGRSAALMFAPFSEVRRDFAIDRITFFWMNLDGTATEDEIKESLQTIAQRNFDINLAKARQRGRGPMGEMGSGGGRRRDYTASVNLQSAEGVRKTVNARADGIIWTLSLLPLITLAVASLGVVNTVLSSIRARRWDMGVLRGRRHAFRTLPHDPCGSDPGRHRGLPAEPRLRRNGRLLRHGHNALHQYPRRADRAADHSLGQVDDWLWRHARLVLARSPVARHHHGAYRTLEAPASGAALLHDLRGTLLGEGRLGTRPAIDDHDHAHSDIMW